MMFIIFFRQQLLIYAQRKVHCKDDGEIDMSLIEKDFIF